MHTAKKCFTKIVATVGYASSSREMLYQLIQAGVNVFRLNFSHGEHQGHAQVVDHIRSLEAEHGFCVGILADLQGPKLRVGTFAKGEITLQEKESFILDLEDAPGDATRVQFPHPEMYKHLVPGTLLLLDDGKLRLEVVENTLKSLHTKVIHGGILKDRKGVNIPGVALPISALTAKDLVDLDFIVTLDVDYIALSFVQTEDDVADLKQRVQGRFKVLAKIEKPMALKHLDAIIKAADGVMVARGDLGVEMPLEEVPKTQKHIVALSKKYGKPVIVATQMLESMVEALTPTRAEASDVANAVYEGADAVMLSAESAIGAHPVKVVEFMQRTLKTTEQDAHYRSIIAAARPLPDTTATDAITLAANDVADTIGAKAIAIFTATGSSVARAVRQRPLHPIICVTRSQKTAQFLTLYWGVTPYVIQAEGNLRHMVECIDTLCRENGIAKRGECVVITGGEPLGSAGNTNFLHVREIA